MDWKWYFWDEGERGKKKRSPYYTVHPRKVSKASFAAGNTSLLPGATFQAYSPTSIRSCEFTVRKLLDSLDSSKRALGFAMGCHGKVKQSDRERLRQCPPGLHLSLQHQHNRPAAVPNKWAPLYFAGRAGMEHGYPQDEQLDIPWFLRFIWVCCLSILFQMFFWHGWGVGPSSLSLWDSLSKNSFQVGLPVPMNVTPQL